MKSAAHKPPRWQRWRRYLAAALLLHLLFTGGLYWGVDWLRERVSRPAAMPLLVFELQAPPLPPPVAEAGAAEPAPMTALPAPPRAVPVLARPVADVVAELPLPEAAPESTQESTQESTPESTQDAASAAIAAPSNGRMTRAGDGEAVQHWEALLLQHLDRHKRYPVWAERRGQEDLVQVQVRIDRDGQVLERRIVDSRGYALLDAEVLDLLVRASPLPLPPPEVADRDLEFRLPVEFYIDRRVARLW